MLIACYSMLMQVPPAHKSMRAGFSHSLRSHLSGTALFAPPSVLSARHSTLQTGFLPAPSSPCLVKLCPCAALQEEAEQLWPEGGVGFLFLHSCFWQSSLQKQRRCQEHVQHAEQGSLPRHTTTRPFWVKTGGWMLPSFPRAHLPLQHCCSPFWSLEPGLFWMHQCCRRQ